MAQQKARMSYGFGGWGREPFEKVKTFLFQISKCTHFSTIKMMARNECLAPKMKPAVALYNRAFPYWTPCMKQHLKKFLLSD